MQNAKCKMASAKRGRGMHNEERERWRDELKPDGSGSESCLGDYSSYF
jgi:hypothetical protein